MIVAASVFSISEGKAYTKNPILLEAPKFKLDTFKVSHLEKIGKFLTSKSTVVAADELDKVLMNLIKKLPKESFKSDEVNLYVELKSKLTQDFQTVQEMMHDVNKNYQIDDDNTKKLLVILSDKILVKMEYIIDYLTLSLDTHQAKQKFSNGQFKIYSLDELCTKLSA